VEPLGELQPGVHWPCRARCRWTGSAEWPEHEVIALGHLLAEGNLCHPHSVYFYNQDPAEIDDYVAAAEAFGNVRCTRGTKDGTTHVYAARVDRAREPEIFAWARRLGMLGKTATHKEVPADAFTLRSEQVALLLSRMWAGDGHINTRDRSLFYATSSRRLAGQVQHLLLRLGILGRVRRVDFPYRGGKRAGWQVFVTGNENLRRFAETVGARFLGEARREAVERLVLEAPAQGPSRELVPVGVRALVRAAKERAGQSWAQVEAGADVSSRDFHPTGTSPAKIGFTRRTVGMLAEHFGDAELRRAAESDVLWDRVESIEYVGEKQTYDLEVPVTHNFVANDIIVHNSHSAAYGLLAYQTAWLKCHYPAEFMSALMSSVVDKIDDVVSYIQECREMGKYLPRVGPRGDQRPPAARERIELEVHGGGRGHRPTSASASAPSAAWARARCGRSWPRARRRGRSSRCSTCSAASTCAVQQARAGALICAGALDGFEAEGGRAQLLAGLESAFATAQSIQRERDSAQDNLFDMLMGGGDGLTATGMTEPPLPPVEKWQEGERLAREKEILGFFISGHPLDKFREDVALFERVNTANLREFRDQKIELACVVTEAARQISKKDGSEWGRITVEDFYGTATVLAFGESWARWKDVLQQDTPILLRGAVSSRDRDEEDPPIFLDGAVRMAELRESGSVGVCVELGSDGADHDRIQRARECFARYPGPGPLEVVWQSGGTLAPGDEPRLRSRSVRVAPSEVLLTELRAVLGDERVKLVKG
jgi:DNA polymerase-3 subunit alpha